MMVLGVSCYGDVAEDSNFEVVCVSEENDCCWTDGNTKTDQPFKTWEEAVTFFKEEFSAGEVLEVTAC